MQLLQSVAVGRSVPTPTVGEWYPSQSVELLSTRNGDCWDKLTTPPIVTSWLPYSDLLVARTLVNLDRKQISLRVMNLSTLPQNDKGTELAHCETLPADCTIETDATDDDWRTGGLWAQSRTVEVK